MLAVDIPMDTVLPPTAHSASTNAVHRQTPFPLQTKQPRAPANAAVHEAHPPSNQYKHNRKRLPHPNTLRRLPKCTEERKDAHTSHLREKKRVLHIEYTRQKRRKTDETHSEAKSNKHTSNNAGVLGVYPSARRALHGGSPWQNLFTSPLKYQAISTDCAAQRRTRFLYASMSVLNSWAASGLAGLEALGSVNRD